MNFGMESPCVYCENKLRECNIILHLQCLSVVHYKWVGEKRNYERYLMEMNGPKNKEKVYMNLLRKS